METNQRSEVTGHLVLLGAWFYVAVAAVATVAAAAELPAVSHPRSTSGDSAVEPDWSQRLSITVGPEQADVVGTSDRAVQAAVDYVARLGGGTVSLKPGTYRLRNAVYLQSKVRLIGSGPGVKYGLAENNLLNGNRVGVSIGHRDTDNLVTGNEIVGSREVGVLFRPERGRDFAGHRNRIENNRIVDIGSTNGIAVDVQGATESVVLSGNRIIETRAPAGRIGIRLGPQTKAIQLQSNQIAGFSTDVQHVSGASPQ